MRFLVISIMLLWVLIPIGAWGAAGYEPARRILIGGPSGTEPPIELIIPGDLYSFKISTLGGTPKRIVPGFFSDDSLMDFIVHDGATASLLFGAEVFNCSWPTASVVSDVCGYRATGDSRHRNLAVTNGSGLHTWAYGSGGLISSVPVGTAAWAGARSLQAGRLDGGPSTDVVAISSTNQILVMTDIESAPATELSFPVGGNPVDLVLLDWTGDGTQEIVVRTGSGLHIFEPDGTLVDRIRGYHPEGAITRLQVNGHSDWIAWVTRGPMGANEFLVLLNQSIPGMTHWLGVPSTGAITAGDISGDGLPDLVLRRGDDGDVMLLVYTGTGYAPSDPDFTQTIPGRPGDGADGKPLLVDLDGDDDLDIFWGIDHGERIRMIRSSIKDDSSLSPDLLEVRFDLEDTTGKAYLKFLFRNAALPPDGFTHLQCVVFRKSSPNGLTSPTPQGKYLVPVVADPPPSPGTVGMPPNPPTPVPPTSGPGGGQQQHPNPVDPVPVPRGGGGPVRSPYPVWQLELEESELEFDAIYAVVLRYVTVTGPDALPVIVDSSPTRVLLFTPETYADMGRQGPIDYLLGLSQSPEWFAATPDVAPVPGQEHDLLSVGTLITSKPVPDLGDDEEPDFKASSQ